MSQNTKPVPALAPLLPLQTPSESQFKSRRQEAQEGHHLQLLWQLVLWRWQQPSPTGLYLLSQLSSGCFVMGKGALGQQAAAKHTHSFHFSEVNISSLGAECESGWGEPRGPSHEWFLWRLLDCVTSKESWAFSNKQKIHFSGFCPFACLLPKWDAPGKELAVLVILSRCAVVSNKPYFTESHRLGNTAINTSNNCNCISPLGDISILLKI